MKKFLLATALVVATTSAHAATREQETEAPTITNVKTTAPNRHHNTNGAHTYTHRTENEASVSPREYRRAPANYYVVDDRQAVNVIERPAYYREAHPAYYSSFGGGKNNVAEYDWNHWDIDRKERVVYRPVTVAPAYTSYNWHFEPVTTERVRVVDNAPVVQDNRWGENPQHGWSRTHRFDRIRMHS